MPPTHRRFRPDLRRWNYVTFPFSELGNGDVDYNDNDTITLQELRAALSRSLCLASSIANTRGGLSPGHISSYLILTQLPSPLA